jgi:carbonic anhydrase
MCTKRNDHSESHSSDLPRRNFVKLAGAAALSFGFFKRAQAAEVSAPAKPQNVLSPDAALNRLMEGNARYVSGKLIRHDFISERPSLALGQNPFAGILGCADSRVGPEYAFDTGRGDLFVCRVAGNFADVNSIASLEYAVAVLGTPLILVLGHKKCGAVDAAVKAIKDGREFPGHIPALVEAIRPAVEASQNQPGDLLDNAIQQNVTLNAEKLKTAPPILSSAAKEGKLKIVGGVYNLETGRIVLIA